MGGTYLGHLSEHDPLYGYLQHDIQPQVCDASGSSTYRVFKLNGSNDVYRYEDRNTGTKFIGKFFLSSRKRGAVKAGSRMTREFDNLCMMRGYGLAGCHHHVVRPLGRNYSMNALLVTEYRDGQLLSEVITEVNSWRRPRQALSQADRTGVFPGILSQPYGNRRRGRIPPRLRIYGSPDRQTA